MTKTEILKKSRNQIEVLKDLLLEEKESRNKLELNYKYLSDAVNSGLRKNSELQAENDKLMILKDDKKRLNHELRNKLADARAEIKSLKAENAVAIADERIIKELQADNECLKGFK